MKSHVGAPLNARLNIQWMDAMSWRLPSGKALAEFALQSGFLAPLLLSGPMGNGRVGGKRKEAPDLSGRFRRGPAASARRGE